MSTKSQEITIPDGRLTGLDLLRMVATLLVVALHAGIPYLPETMPGLAWTVEGISPSQQSVPVTWFVWGIECFIMPLFFVMSGVSTRIMLDRRGVESLLKNRKDRLLMPFLYFGVPILIIEFYLWNLGNVFQGDLTWKQYWRFDAKDYDPRLWGIGHFWYLEYLLVYTVILAMFCRVCGTLKAGIERWFSWLGAKQYPALVGVCLIWAVGFMSYYPEIVADFDHRFFPIAKRFFYFGIYFVAGFILVSSVRKSPQLAMRTATALLLLAVLSLSVAVPQIRDFLGGPSAPFEQYRGLSLSLVAMGFSIGLTTLILVKNPTLSSNMKYLIESSYWVYFIHHLLCGAIHLGLDRFEWPVAVKYVVTFVGATLFSLVAYHLFIRNRWPEVIFNGRTSTPSEIKH